jgi:hypothetical protein
MTIEEMLNEGRGGSRESAYSAPAKPKKKRKNPTKDLSIGGAMRNLRSRRGL